MDHGETSRAAAARELLEETGIRVSEEELRLVGVYDRPDRDPRGRYVSAAYAVTVPAGTRARAGDDAAAVQWVPADAPGHGLAFDHAEIIHAAKETAEALPPGDVHHHFDGPTYLTHTRGLGRTHNTLER